MWWGRLCKLWGMGYVMVPSSNLGGATRVGYPPPPSYISIVKLDFW